MRVGEESRRELRAKAVALRDSPGLIHDEGDREKVMQDVKAGHKPPPRRQAQARKAVGPSGKELGRPVHGKQHTQARTKADRVAAKAKAKGPKKLKGTRGSPKGIRRIRNRGRHEVPTVH